MVWSKRPGRLSSLALGFGAFAKPFVRIPCLTCPIVCPPVQDQLFKFVQKTLSREFHFLTILPWIETDSTVLWLCVPILQLLFCFRLLGRPILDRLGGRDRGGGGWVGGGGGGEGGRGAARRLWLRVVERGGNVAGQVGSIIVLHRVWCRPWSPSRWTKLCAQDSHLISSINHKIETNTKSAA